ncbi:MAG: hypothetical protein Q612_NSC00109G0002, partial [Negativicoccus succinicivorans DORA_17_25]
IFLSLHMFYIISYLDMVDENFIFIVIVFYKLEIIKYVNIISNLL